MTESLLLIVSLAFNFSRVVGFIKSVIFVEETFRRLITSDRKEYLLGHVYEEHSEPIEYCLQNQCASL